MLDGNDKLPEGDDIEPTPEPTEEPIVEFSVANGAADANSAVDYSLPGTSAGTGVTENNMLNDVILELLGDDPTISTTYGTEIHKDLAVRLEYIATLDVFLYTIKFNA